MAKKEKKEEQERTENKGKRSFILIYFAIIILIIVILNLILIGVKPKQQAEKTEIKENFVADEGKVLVRMKLPAVDDAGNGVASSLEIEAKPGSGKTLVDIENLLFWADTQHSIRIARLVANDLSKIDVKSVDLVYNVEANASVIGGPSAGAALAIATIAAIGARKPRDDVMITGTINRDGSIGPVTAIIEKAKASKQAGAKIFLVPLLQSRDAIYETEQSCEEFGLNEICTTETKPRKVNVSEEAGIEVIEVESIEEAMKYFF